MRVRALLVAVIAIVALCGAAPHVSSVPPSADSDVGLSDGRVLHVLALPLGRIDGIVLDGATFDASGSRIVMLARFPSGAIDGDWHRAAPTQAYVADIARRTLTALTSDGLATAIHWSGSSTVIVTDAGHSASFDVGAASTTATQRGYDQLDRVTATTNGTLVSPASEFRLQVLKEDSGAYALGQVGAVRLRTIAVSSDHRQALVGSFVAWIDSSKSRGASFSRVGPDDVLPPTFSDAYGSVLTPVLPLGHLVYQGAYRNGIAYFAFAFGLQRIVAATSDFFNYSYPALPAQPDFTVGDGFGAGADGVLYFADPENRALQIWRNGKYVEFPMMFPDNVSGTGRLFSAMTTLTNGGREWPPIDPDQDALDAAILEWRIYPIGDVTGQGWVASYLGRSYVSGGDRRFREISEPAFPFAVLSRTDDGRLWGASVTSKTIRHGIVVRSTSTIWSSRDGLHWSRVGYVSGGAGAVGLHGEIVWVALSAFEDDAQGVEITRFLAGSRGQPTGAIYAGEDLFFVDLSGSFYLVSGGAPGTRDDDTSGALTALRLDTGVFSSYDFLKTYWSPRIQPIGASSGSDASVAVAKSSLATLADEPDPTIPTIVDADSPGFTKCCLLTATLMDVGQSKCCRWMTPDVLQQFELEYAWTPYPLARVSTAVNGDTASVARTFERGPLNVEGQRERWSRDASGSWSLQAVLARWKI